MNPSLRRAAGSTLAVILAVGPLPAAQAGSINVSESVTLPVKPAAAWALVGDFSGLEIWHPAVVASTLQGTGQARGDIRVLTLGNGAEIREELLSWDGEGMSYRYDILASPLPVSGYSSTLSVTADGQGGSRITWTSNFDPKGDTPAGEAEETIRGVYRGGLDAVAGLFR